jgi:prepilin-type N-terminal cleavage/methylation domain-containing protein
MMKIARLTAKSRCGFTLMEIVMALAVLGTMAGGCYVGFNAVNTYSVSSRLYSEAEAAAHNQIDLILSKEPFNLGVQPTRVPIEVMTTAELDTLAPQPLSSPPPTTNQYYPYYRNYTYTGGPLAKQAFVYTDPVTGTVVVTGTLTAFITDTGSTMTFAGSTANLNVRCAHVEVKYSFRNRDSVNNPTNYTVALDTMRTANQ